MVAGLLPYVASLKVANRDRKDGMDEGRYSVADEDGCGDCSSVVFDGDPLRGVREAARDKTAVRWGVLFDQASEFRPGVSLRDVQRAVQILEVTKVI